MPTYVPPPPFEIPGIPPLSSMLGRIPTNVKPFYVGELPQASTFLGTPVAQAGGSGLLSQLASPFKALGGGEFRGAGLLKTALPGIAGELGSYGIRKALPGSGTAEHVLSGASKGAGIGAGIGLAGGPFAEISVPVGSLVGAGVGALGGLLFGGKKKSSESVTPEQQLAKAYAAAGLDSTTQAELSQYYTVINTLGGNTKESRQQALSTVGQLIMKEMQSKLGSGGTGPAAMTPSQNAAIQMQTQRFLAPYLKSSLDTAQAAAQATLSQLGNVPEQYRGVLAAGASQQLAATTRLANAYAAQAQLSSQAFALEQQQQQQQALASQLQQQAYAAQMANGYGGYNSAGAGGSDFASLIGQ